MNISEKHISRYHTAKLIPELSKLLDEGKINQEAASLYAMVPFEKQKKIYSILMDKYSNDKLMKRGNPLKFRGEAAKDENKKEMRNKLMPTTTREIALYSVPELSQKLNVTTFTIRNYLKQGKIKGQKVMGRWFISEEEIKDFFESGSTR